MSQEERPRIARRQTGVLSAVCQMRETGFRGVLKGSTCVEQPRDLKLAFWVISIRGVKWVSVTGDSPQPADFSLDPFFVRTGS